MERVISVEEVRNTLARPRQEGRTVGFVPTMGVLHEGHLSLVRASQRHTDITVVSIFVNPRQFGPGEDYEAYPRDTESDTAVLEAEDVPVLFTPTDAIMYPAGASTVVDPGPLGEVWCGANRPGHFAGVATVVTKFFNIVEPDMAFFGEKDFQQLRVIEHVAADLDMKVRIAGCPIVRENDGLAMSTRNRYLTPEQRHSATVLYRELCATHDAACAGETDAVTMAENLRHEIAAEPGVELEYAVIVDVETLEQVTTVCRPSRALVAARVGAARLIDNVAIPVPGTCEEHPHR